MAYASLSHLYMSAEDASGTGDWGARALALAEELEDEEVSVYARTNILQFAVLTGADTTQELAEIFERAHSAGLEEPPAGRS